MPGVILGSEYAIISMQVKALPHGSYSHFKNINTFSSIIQDLNIII